jgi:hypothetical protein
MTHGDTKAHWKRRALRAEAELETMRKSAQWTTAWKSSSPTSRRSRLRLNN